jgi:energy-coupling factor transport system substrate-specific component
MEKKLVSVKTVVAIVIGSALMFALNRYLQIPLGVLHTYLYLGAAILSVFAATFGPIAGLLIGFIGHTLTDLMGGEGVWWSWVIADAFYGFAVGFFWKHYKIEEGEFDIMQVLIFNGVQIAANLLAWVAIAPALDILIYHEPANTSFSQGFIAGALNIGVVLILGSVLAFGYSATRAKADSLKAE